MLLHNWSKMESVCFGLDLLVRIVERRFLFPPKLAPTHTPRDVRQPIICATVEAELTSSWSLHAPQTPHDNTCS